MRQILKSDSLESITLKMTSSLNLQEVLTSITQGLVDELDAAFARIWLLGPGDLCAECFKADNCFNRERCLHLKASAGMYTRINGEYRRVPLGALKIGRIAQGEGPICTNNVEKDDRLPNKRWLRDNKLRSFAGYPLIFQNELLGAMAIFSRHALNQTEFGRLAIFAHQASIAIKNAQLYFECKQAEEALLKANEELEQKVEERTRELREKQTQLVQSEKMASLGQIVAGVAHEINSPLGALKSNIDIYNRAFEKLRNILSDPELPQEIRQHPELVRLFDNVENLRAMSDTASERLISIVDSLRKFARLDMAEMDEVDIHEGLETTLTLAQHEFQNRVEIIRDYGQLPSITCHPNQRWL